MSEPADGPPTRRATSPWAPLRHRVFLALFIAQLASNVGTLMQNVGSAWLMGDLHTSTALVALVQTATFLPVLLVGIPAGALADIVDRRRLILATQVWMMVFAFLLAVLSFAHEVTPNLLLALTLSATTCNRRACRSSGACSVSNLRALTRCSARRRASSSCSER